MNQINKNKRSTTCNNTQHSTKRDTQHSTKRTKHSPFSQLFKMLQTQEQKDILFETLEPLKDEYRDDFCIACVAYIRFGIRRYFPNKMMQVLFLSYCELL